ncbi:MAG TPA: cytochrome c biogenesis protein CcdA [Jatrophihabitantaceae bacterium]
MPLAGFSHVVTDGPLLVAAAVAALVGLIGFLSPCVLPLVPGYLSYVAGLAGSGQQARPRRVVGGAALFVAGFTVIFVLEGVLFGALGAAIRNHAVAIERVLGVVTIAMGVVFLGGIPFLQREWRISALPRAGLLGAPLLGAAFGLAWAPCLTPTFSAVYGLAFSQGTAGRGAFLMTCYCLGLGVPFLLVALGVGWISGVLTFVRRHKRVVSQVGGVLLIVIGVLLVSGLWNHWMDELRSAVGPGAGVGANL